MLGTDEHIVVREVKERAGDGDSKRSGVDSTTSSSNADSMQVEAALLAGDSQHMHWSRRMQNKNLPVSSVPPTSHSERPNRLIMR